MKNWSRSALYALCMVVVGSSLALQAQTNAIKPTNDNLTTAQPNLKPQLSVSDLVFTLNTLASVNIVGSEVEAYIDVKSTFVRAFEQAQKDKKLETDVITVEMSVLTANNFLQLFQRANLQGSAAEKFMAVKNALYASAPKPPSTSGTPSPVLGVTGQK